MSDLTQTHARSWDALVDHARGALTAQSDFYRHSSDLAVIWIRDSMPRPFRGDALPAALLLGWAVLAFAGGRLLFDWDDLGRGRPYWVVGTAALAALLVTVAVASAVLRRKHTIGLPYKLEDLTRQLSAAQNTIDRCIKQGHPQAVDLAPAVRELTCGIEDLMAEYVRLAPHQEHSVYIATDVRETVTAELDLVVDAIIDATAVVIATGRILYAQQPIHPMPIPAPMATPTADLLDSGQRRREIQARIDAARATLADHLAQ